MMKRNDWKRQLQQDAWNHVPNQLPAIREAIQGLEQARPARFKSRWIPRLVGVTGLAATIVIGLVVWLTPTPAPILTEAYVSLDINPSLELMVDGNQKVLVQIPRNEEASIVLNGVNLVGESLTVAIQRFIEEATQAGYLDVTTSDNAILLEVLHDNDEWEGELRTAMQHAAEQAFTHESLFGVVLTGPGEPSFKAAAAAAGLSVGKYFLVERLLALDASLDQSELAHESVRNLQTMLTERDVSKEVRQTSYDTALDQLASLYQGYLAHPSAGNRHWVEAKLSSINTKYGTAHTWSELSLSAIEAWREESFDSTTYGQFVASERFQRRNARNEKVASADLPSLQQQMRAECDENWVASEQARYQQDWAAAKATWATKFNEQE